MQAKVQELVQGSAVCFADIMLLFGSTRWHSQPLQCILNSTSYIIYVCSLCLLCCVCLFAEPVNIRYLNLLGCRDFSSFMLHTKIFGLKHGQGFGELKFPQI